MNNQQEQDEIRMRLEEALERAEEIGLPRADLLLLYWGCGLRYPKRNVTQMEIAYAR